ncbi:MAG: DUF262 domain-containing protein [Ignavibacteriaceae bacterium]|nr:DUF262 domain-containing protein [Ignavibacteriaceae bacterium]
MKTESHSINDVLAKNATSFFIPPFQRAYAWGRTEIDRFFNDISRIIDSELNETHHDKLEHFFGTLVIKDEKSGFANKSVVVDGQQRLTTTLLFLIALRDSEADSNNKSFITEIYLLNSSASFQDKIKLKQVTKDWESYKALVNNSQPEPGFIANGYQQLKSLIEDKRRIKSQLRFEHFIIALRRINVAVIFLDERPFKGEDPQIIFETLNSLGKPLTLSDLVRNFILLSMESSRQTEIFETIWHPKIENKLQESTSKFFRDYLQFKLSKQFKVVSENNTKELYAYFKDFVEYKFIDRIAFVNDIIRFVKLYAWIINEINVEAISNSTQHDKAIKELLRNIFHDIQSEAFKPLVLGLLDYHQQIQDGVKLSDELLISILTIIRTYLIRRRVVGVTQGENKYIVTLCSRINDLVSGNKNIIELLSGSYYRLRLPNDIEIRTMLESMNFYEGMKKYSKFILGKIEENNTKVSVDFRNPKIAIEHIMPQTINKDWELELGTNYDEIHTKYLHNIGNLILTEFNGEMGNRSFKEKKSKLNESSLQFRLDIINRSVWSLKSIEEHKQNMIQCFLETFPLPDNYKRSLNWNTRSVESNVFSPLDDDAGNIVSGEKPSELTIQEKIFKVSSWQDVFVKFLLFLNENSSIDFDYIYENQVELFRRDNVLLKWRALKEMLDSKADLSNKYKTLDGKLWNKVKELDDETLFVHINIAAATCISRIADVMVKFNLPESFVTIKLRPNK